MADNGSRNQFEGEGGGGDFPGLDFIADYEASLAPEDNSDGGAMPIALPAAGLSSRQGPRGPLTLERREQRAIVRKIGACPPCRQRKIRCLHAWEQHERASSARPSLMEERPVSNYSTQSEPRQPGYRGDMPSGLSQIDYNYRIAQTEGQVSNGPHMSTLAGQARPDQLYADSQSHFNAHAEFFYDDSSMGAQNIFFGYPDYLGGDSSSSLHSPPSASSAHNASQHFTSNGPLLETQVASQRMRVGRASLSSRISDSSNHSQQIGPGVVSPSRSSRGSRNSTCNRNHRLDSRSQSRHSSGLGTSRDQRVTLEIPDTSGREAGYAVADHASNSGPRSAIGGNTSQAEPMFNQMVSASDNRTTQNSRPSIPLFQSISNASYDPIYNLLDMPNDMSYHQLSSSGLARSDQTLYGIPLDDQSPPQRQGIHRPSGRSSASGTMEPRQGFDTNRVGSINRRSSSNNVPDHGVQRSRSDATSTRRIPPRTSRNHSQIAPKTSSFLTVPNMRSSRPPSTTFSSFLGASLDSTVSDYDGRMSRAPSLQSYAPSSAGAPAYSNEGSRSQFGDPLQQNNAQINFEYLPTLSSNGSHYQPQHEVASDDAQLQDHYGGLIDPDLAPAMDNFALDSIHAPQSSAVDYMGAQFGESQPVVGSTLQSTEDLFADMSSLHDQEIIPGYSHINDEMYGGGSSNISRWDS